MIDILDDFSSSDFAAFEVDVLLPKEAFASVANESLDGPFGLWD